MLRVGIIGTGAIANLNVQGYLFSHDTELVAICDVDLNNAQEKVARWGLRTLKIYKNYKEMIDKEDLDIAEILTPHHLHGSMTEYCAKAGVPGISVQKPMAHTIRDCEKMITVCKEQNVKLKIFENFRFYPVYLRAKELLDQGIIGELLNFRINTIATAGPGMPKTLKELLWRQNFKICGGGPWIYDDGYHKLSMALWLMNQERVEKVYSWIDYSSAIMDMPNIVFWKYPLKNPDDPPKFGSMQFTMAINLYFPSNYYEVDEFIEISGTKGIMWINQCTSGGNIFSRTPQFAPIVVYVDGEVKTYGDDLPRDWRYSFINSTVQFIKVMKEGGEPIYNGKQGKDLCVFGKMPYISQQDNRIVSWEEITAENEKNRSCVVKDPKAFDPRGLTKLYMKKKKDMRKGKKQGLEHYRLLFQL